jgi:CheY-like chemotaxis protein
MGIPAAVGIERVDALDAVVLDPHPIWLDAIELVLGRIGATVVLKTSSSSEAVAMIERNQPRLLTLELDTPPGEPDGFEVIRRASTLAPSLRAIVL